MVTKLYNKMPGDIIEKDNYKARRKELITCLLYNDFYSMEEFVSL
jgi:ATP-dependent Clp protease adapter protein ClpS